MSDNQPIIEPMADRSAQGVAIIGAGLALIAVQALLPMSGFWAAVFLGAGCALVAAALVFLALRGYRCFRRATGLSIARDMGVMDPALMVICDHQLRIVDRNPVARRLEPDEQLVGILANHIASPELILQKLRVGLGEGHSAREVMMTRTGPLTISVLGLPDGLSSWRIELPATADPEDGGDGFPMLTVSASGRVLNVNQALIRYCGERPTLLEHVFDGREPRSGEINAVRSGLGLRDVLVVAIPGEDDRTDIVLIPDGTPAMSESDRQAGWDAVEEVPVPLLKVSLTGEVLASNREARELLRSDLRPGTHMGDLLEGLGRPMDDWLRESHSMPKRPDPQFLRGGGVRKDLFLQVALCKPRGDDQPYVIAVLHNVTEFKALEAQFVQSQKMQAIGQLAGGVAHDFNNLLTAISGHCDLLLLRHTDGDPDYGDLSQIRQNTIRAAGLVRQLLAFSRKQDFKLVAMDLRDSLSDLTHLLNRLVGERVSMTLIHDPAPLWIKADKRQLEQVIMNLVVNARDALSDGGQVRIEAENLSLSTPMRRDRATVQPGDYVVVRVIDNGAGIPPEIISHIFEPFYTTKGVGEGTGLGLSTAYGIVKQLGGFIFADSEPGEGSTFSIYLPAHRADEADSAADSAGSASLRNPQGGTVLLVEDESPVRAFASRALRMRGYDVVEADCAEAALALLEDKSLVVDLFVSDVVMPGMDGPSWVRVALEERPDTRVVFMSGYSEESLRETRSQIPNSAFLAKPFSLHDLTEMVQEQLSS